MSFKNINKIAVTLVIFVLCANLNTVFAAKQNPKIDVIHYNISLNITDISGQTINGFTEVQLLANENDIDKISLSLKKLEVDSVFLGELNLTFLHTDENLEITLLQNINIGDTITLKIYYHGQPAIDPYWGGFYFSNSDGGYAYNMGVGFADDPHNYGRVWFPCVDNFTDKAKYDFNITTTEDKKAVCGGILIDYHNNADKTISWHWKLKREIPTYLASVAVGNYAFVQNIHKGKEKDILVLLASLPSDSTKLKNSFEHLPECIDIFEQYYIPYQFSRIGFVVVPFNSGAMEHIANIAYPKYAVDGTLEKETLMAHEFSHHWWGNLVTCKTAEDMWLNEGWAVYSEHLFLEKVYSKEKYNQEVQKNHNHVLQYAHISDDGVFPLSPVPHDITYGTHVYDKGADVVHTLRSYLGDSLFFLGIQKYLKAMAFKSASSYDLMDSLSKYTDVDLKDFFDDWVFTKGFPHFYIEKINSSDLSKTEITICNNPRFNDKQYLNVPLEISFYSKNWEKQTEKLSMSWKKKTFTFELNFQPQMAIIDIERKISDARTIVKQVITEKTKYDFGVALMEINIEELQDSALIVVEHHWNEPENKNTSVKGIRFSDYRYWTVNAVLPNTFQASANIRYNGRTSGSLNGNNYLDHTLNIDNEDSLILLYRKSPEDDWIEYSDYQINTGYKFNKIGDIDINNLKVGDYCLGKYDYTVGFGFINKEDTNIKIYPNPTGEQLNIEFSQINKNQISLKLINLSGKILKEVKLDNKLIVSIPVHDIERGTYIIEINNNNKKICKKVVLGI
ncbi:MAG: M1 family aminopeptidase [Bacteroidota bacterium]|nr:M1 family aminopeptidase [Bacteroidota bacterium]